MTTWVSDTNGNKCSDDYFGSAEAAHATSRRLRRLAEQMRDKRYRDAYVASHTRQMLARQMRKFRGGMSQAEFAGTIGKRQTIISRLENPDYSGWTLRTLFEVAKAINVAVFVRFVDFPTFLHYSDDLSASALHPASYSGDALDELASSTTAIKRRSRI